MAKLGDWIKDKYKSQAAFAELLGVTQSRVSKWLSGYEPIPDDFQKRIEGLKYKGPWPRQEAEETAAPTGDRLTREDFLKAIGGLESRLKDLEGVVEDLAEGLYAAIPSMPPRSRRAGRSG